MVAGAAGGDAGGAAEEKTEFDVVLKNAGASKNKAEAEDIKGKLEAAGAEVELA